MQGVTEGTESTRRNEVSGVCVHILLRGENSPHKQAMKVCVMKDVKPSDRVTRGGAACWDGEAKASLKCDMCSKTGEQEGVSLATG